MRTTREHRLVGQTRTILIFILLASLPYNTAKSLLQQKKTLQSAGRIQYYKDFGPEDIVLEYGAESGVLQPPWDRVRQEPGYSQVKTVSDVARTGSKSVKFETLVDYVRIDSYPYTECSIREYDLPTEVYLSWWHYFPAGYFTNMLEVKDTVGGFKYMWGGRDNEWRMRFMITATGKVRFSLSGTTIPDEYRDYAESSISPVEGTWTHFQVYWKESDEGHGIVRAWYNDFQLYERIGSGDFYTDPQYWDPNAPDGPRAVVQRYTSENDPAGYTYADDIVIATEKIPETYRVDRPSISFESWEDGFESGDFSRWSKAQVSGPTEAWVNVTSTYAYRGVRSANFTTDGSHGSSARVIKTVHGVTEIYQRSYVRFEGLPDNSNTEINTLRVAQDDGTWIASAGIYNLSGNIYWMVEVTGFPLNYTLDAVTSGTWYSMELYLSATTNGNATLWIDGALKCQITGDFSEVGDIARVAPYVYIDGAQNSAKTVYHDDFRVDNRRISADSRASSIELMAEPDTIWREGGTSHITVQLKDARNQTVSQSGVTIIVEVSIWAGPVGKEPTLIYEDQGGLSVTVTTDSNGQATITFTVQSPWGGALIEGSGFGLSSGYAMIMIEPKSP
ncbi:hypothetical protein GTO27_02135 [Candidatus Bathyarchaeota archaeon]|nr:hypothetical protein [Candidatus Bathyarchaeota archaeon]